MRCTESGSSERIGSARAAELPGRASKLQNSEIGCQHEPVRLELRLEMRKMSFLPLDFLNLLSIIPMPQR